MSEWKEVKLGDYIDMTNGYAFKSKSFVNRGIPVLKIKNIKTNKIIIEDIDYISADDNNPRYTIIKPNDLIITMTGNRIDGSPETWVGKVALFNLDGKYFLNQRLSIIRVKKDLVNLLFILYSLTTIDAQKYFITHATSSGGQANISPDIVKNFTIKLPSYIIQSEIAGILSSLDAKIETNNKLNEKLEEMAQAIFKSWFVDFEPFKDKPFHETELGMIPEGWEVGSLSDIATITMGQSPCGTSYNENGEGIIFYQGRTEFGFRFPSIRLYTTAPSRFAEVGSTLMSVRAPVGDINMALLRCCIGRGVASIKSNCDCDSYIYYLMKSLKKRFDIYNGEGTVFGSVGRDTLRGMLITIPPSSVISDFEMNISKIDSRIKTNELESQRLASLRDTLFPRLMSGELIV